MAFDLPSGLMKKSGSPIDLSKKSSVKFNDVDIKIIATGKTSGHIADAHIQNNSRKKTTVTIPAGEIPKEILSSREARQGFFITEPQDLEIPGKTSITVPIRGYCNDPTLDPPGPGMLMTTPDKWNTPLDDIQTIRRITTATHKIQKEGMINTPFSQDPERERDVIIQQTVWVHLIEGHDPCQSIRQLLTGNISGTGSEYEDYGVAQIMDAIRRVGRSSGLESFTPPDLPSQAGEVHAPALIDGPVLKKELKITVKGTGETTGHIADISVTNPNDHPVIVRPGTGDNPVSSGFYIPSAGHHHQPYIVPSLKDIPVGPKETVVAPVEGYCVDIRRPPVPDSDPMPDLASWVGLPTDPPSTLQSSDGTPIIHVPTRTALSTTQAADLLLGGTDEPKIISIRPWMPHAAKTGWDCPTTIGGSYPTFPGTDAPIVNILKPDKHLGVLVPVLLEGVDRIIRTTDIMLEEDMIRTPFTNNPSQEREAVIQQTFWMYTSAISGDDYPKKEFESNTFEQFENATGEPVNNLAPEQKAEIVRGVEDFWGTFQAVGAQAKVLPPSEKPQDITPEQKKTWQTFEKRRSSATETTPVRTPKGIAKPEPDRIPKMASDPTVQSPGNADEPSNDEEDESEDEPCKCNDMTFDLVIRRVHPEDNDRAANLHNKEIKIENAGKTNEMDIDVQDWKQGDYYTISLMRGKMNCTCMNAGSAEAIICDFYSKSKNITQKNKLKIEEDPSKRKDVESLDGKKGDRTDFKFTFSPKEPKSNVIKFCFSAYCYSDECNDSKSGVKCKDYCLELTFKEVK